MDFKGSIHLAVLERMGILDAIRAASVPSEDGSIIDARGRRIGTTPGRFAGGDINVPRGDLAAILHGLTAGRCAYRFGDTITALDQGSDDVAVAFARAAPERFDLVIGADGIHSTTRRLAFGPEADYVKHLGYHYALVGLPAGEEDAMYNEPGRMAALGGAKAPAWFVFASDAMPGARDDTGAQKQFLIDAYRGAGWRVAELMAGVPDAQEFYLDAISRVTIDRYAASRVALVGDAAYGNALGGFGTGLAVVGAYVPAGELHRAGGDHQRAFTAYEARYRGYASVSQKVNAGRLLGKRCVGDIWRLVTRV